MIPKKIHYCWFGENPKNELMIRCMKTWKTVMPDYEIKEWNESNSPVELPYCKSALEKGLWSKVANFIRLWVLYNEGGIYLDTDFEVLKKFDRFLIHECFVGFQSVEERPGWVTNGIIGAVKGNKFVEKCINKTLEIFKKKNEFAISSQMTTLVLKEMGLKDYGFQFIQDVAIYSAEYFYPYLWLEKFDPACIKENTYAVHHWNMSWVKKQFNNMKVEKSSKSNKA
jgi:mannosyltransferase OCH1-like enzyme